MNSGRKHPGDPSWLKDAALAAVAALVTEIHDDGNHDCEGYKDNETYQEARNGKPESSLAWPLT